MTSINEYQKKLRTSISKIKNNCNYFESFGNIYITKKLKEYLDNVSAEVEKVQSIVNEITMKK